jgi:RimJ/RimL family protein N-acetyltransferase
MRRTVGEFYLRKPERGDVDALYVFKNDIEIALQLGGFTHGYSKDDLAKWVDYHSTASNEVFWIIADSTDRAVGHVGLYKIDHRIRSAEFAILLGDSTIQGKGLGRSCTRYMVQYGFQQLNLNRIALEVLESNERALRLYRSLGFREEGRLRQAQFKNGKYIDVLLMSLLEGEVTPEAV